MRVVAVLLLAGLAHAGIELFEAEKNLWPDGVEYSLEKPAAEVHFVLAFHAGLGTLGERGTAALASARFVVEYNDADRQTCYWNQYRPLPFDEEANPEWSGDDEAPGLFVTEGASAELTERTLVLRLPRVNRWRIRVTPLEGDDGYVRRAATLVQVAEARDGKPRLFEELDPLLPWEEVEVRAEAEEAEPPSDDELLEEPYEEEYDGEAAAWTTVESVGGTTIRAMRAGKVATGYGYAQTAQTSRAARGRQQSGNNARKAARLNVMPWWQPQPALQPTPKPIPYPRPVAGAPLPFWAIPKPKALATPPTPRLPR